MASKNKQQPNDPNEKEQNCTCYVRSHTKDACPEVKNVTHPLRYYEFTEDEIRALEACDKESFYRRCIPFSTLLGATAYLGVRHGHLEKNPHFGAVPKVAVAMLIGFAVGRLMYTPYYEERLKKLPANSHLGQVMRKYAAEREEEGQVDPKKKKK